MRLGGLIPAWIEALQKMKPGDEWILCLGSRADLERLKGVVC